MSYILEALKKAEAERQLGAAPTIHAPVLDTAVPRTAMLRRPLVVAVGALAVAIGVLAAVLWQRTASVAAAAPAAVVAPPQPVAAVPAPVVKPAAVPAVAPPPPVVAVAGPAPVPPPVVAAAQPAPAAAEPAPDTPAPKPLSKPLSKLPSKPAEEPVQALADLPEPIRRAIPPFSMDGYMYSANPADRLILIDKVLRREGDEVAPGLVLEKLLPKGAVFSFRGYRYRVAF
ncbi:general secretion pathway protein GspB [Pseudoduganella chitinolytica]|uniref:General secretion pathway protein GspB n=1 Tax=Pseudoduganella chitinolytica TaxID=34070 RepID=A0ABY8BIL3_9BURK|nr:general secretion pathway protein GspB [Pseudoduganella chitinolytica]WEF35807.1 general secretion pathway protein GspB [Pseudoduganella chitinolytica]